MNNSQSDLLIDHEFHIIDKCPMTLGITVMTWLPPPQDLIKVNTDDTDAKCS
ncbi:hypothetical protein TIFTF001_002840 [Ficus carica]|uniref:Uncharacterized protein n=1 Tax=Ficus carica TaxID=3494 RepID=A0AA88CT19_FICCA|nr:hypothetical protein TIFTF001_002840 [Ficus carica]